MKSLATVLAAVLTATTVFGAEPSTPPAVRYNWQNVVIGGGGFSPGIVFSTAEKNLAYLRTDVGGAYRWDGKLQRWIPLQDAEWQNSYLGIESIAPDPRDPDVVYLAAGMYYGSPAAIMRSRDRGQSWTVTPVSFAMGGNEDGRIMRERLAVDPNRTSPLLFGSRQLHPAEPARRALFRERSTAPDSARRFRSARSRRLTSIDDAEAVAAGG